MGQFTAKGLNRYRGNGANFYISILPKPISNILS